MLLAVQDVSLGNGVVLLVHQLGLHNVLEFFNLEGVVVIEHIDEVLEPFNEADGGFFVSTGLESRFYRYFNL